MTSRDQSDHIWDSSGQINSTGSSNAYVIAIAEPVAGYFQGMPPIRFKANFGNTGPATANIVTPNAPSGLGAVTLKKFGGATDLVSGDIVSGGVYTLIHDGTNFQVLELNTFTVPSSAIGAAQIANDAVTYAKIQNVSATSRILGRKTSGAGDVEECTLSEVLDFIGSAAQGDILYRGASGWARLPAGTANTFLQTQGAGANPQWLSLMTGLGIKWALIDQTTNDNLTGTYARSGTTVTVTMTAHGLQAGHVVYLDFTTGAATDGLFTVATVPDANTFTVTHGTSGTTSGNVSWIRHTILGSFGVASVTDRVGADGRSAVNFSAASGSGNYGWIGTAKDSDDGGDFIAAAPTGAGLSNTTLVGFMNVQNSGATAANSAALTVMTIGA